MENVAQVESWRDLYVMLGTSAAALVGLLFIVASLHVEEIVNNLVYRLRARNITLHLTAMVVQAAAILTPQPAVALGGELIAVSLYGLWFPVSFTYNSFYRDRATAERGGFSIYRGLTIIIAYFVNIAGAVGVCAGANRGMYLVTVAYVSFVVSAIWNGWTIMLGIGQTAQSG